MFKSSFDMRHHYMRKHAIQAHNQPRVSSNRNLPLASRSLWDRRGHKPNQRSPSILQPSHKESSSSYSYDLQNAPQLWQGLKSTAREHAKMLDYLNTAWASLPDLHNITRRKSYNQLIGDKVLDALFFLPSRMVTRLVVDRLTPDLQGKEILGGIRIIDYRSTFSSGRSVFYVRGFFVSSAKPGVEEQMISLAFFHGSPGYIRTAFPVGSTIFFKGKLSLFSKQKLYVVVHPTPVLQPASAKPIQEIKYPSSSATQSQVVERIVHAALQHLPQVPEWIDVKLLREKQWPSWRQAIQAAHMPQHKKDLSLESPARQRLVFDELLAQHITLQQSVRANRGVARALPATQLRERLLETFPFRLTASQTKAIAEIGQEMCKTTPMLRLLQGDVGSGKTAVALAASVQAIDSGYQVAFLAPTDILAMQHFNAMQKFLEPIGIQPVLYTANQKGKIRKTILEDCASGKLKILVGTHALLEDPVSFAKLGLIIVDEQQRFGVEQRFKLTHKGQDGIVPHTLSISATPIPRTLLLSQYSDMGISYLREKPVCRKEILTRVISQKRLKELTQSLQRVLEAGQQVYWVCPLVEQDESKTKPLSPLTAAQDRHAFLSEHFPGRVALVHGKMKSDEKKEIMEAFHQHKFDILVATTVIEIGVDTPNASVMIIENAERFGLSQLHQLRGRVGRGDQTASCILLHAPDLSDIAKQRLSIVRYCTDGFKIAELDLMLRGAGDMFGTQQSGALMSRLLPNVTRAADHYKTALKIYTDLSALAARTAERIPDFNTPEIQFLLHMFSSSIQKEDLRQAG